MMSLYQTNCWSVIIGLVSYNYYSSIFYMKTFLYHHETIQNCFIFLINYMSVFGQKLFLLWSQLYPYCTAFVVFTKDITSGYDKYCNILTQDSQDRHNWTGRTQNIKSTGIYMNIVLLSCTNTLSILLMFLVCMVDQKC